jgi:hypothetical protein
MSDDVTITFTADISDLQKGMADAASAVDATSESLRSGAAQVGAAFASLTQAYAASLTQRVAATRDASDEQLALARIADRGQFDIALDGIKQQSILVKSQAQTAQLSRTQELTELLQLNDQRMSIERAHLDFVKQSYDEGSKAYANAQRQIDELAAQSALRRQQIEASLSQQIYADYRRSFEQVGSSVSSSIMGMIRGQQTLDQAAQNVALSIVQSFIQARIRTVADWLAGQATKVAATNAAEAAQTASTTAGVAARTSAEQAGATASMATTFGDMLRTVTASAAETFGGIFGFLAPVMGPAAAGPAAAGQASVLAAASAIPSFAVGAWNLPRDMVAQVHRGEMIVPAGVAGGLRDALGGGAGGGVTINHATHFNVSALDAAGVKQWFKSNGRTMMAAINEQVRNGTHLGLSKLNGLA